MPRSFRREPHAAHVDPLAAEWNPFLQKPRPLVISLGQRPVGADDPMPWDGWVIAVVQDRASNPWCPRRDVPVRANEPGRRTADPLDYPLVALIRHGSEG